jgi:hypothetical protein
MLEPRAVRLQQDSLPDEHQSVLWLLGKTAIGSLWYGRFLTSNENDNFILFCSSVLAARSPEK